MKTGRWPLPAKLKFGDPPLMLHRVVHNEAQF